MAEEKDFEIKNIPIDSIQPSSWNPNVEDPDTFNELVESIKNDGFVDPIQVAPTGDIYTIVGGEHRWKAAKIAGLQQIPCVILPWDDDKQKINLIKLNVLKGKMDPAKFTKLFRSMEERYGAGNLRKMIGLGRKDAEFRRLLREVKKGLPEEVQAEIDKRADKIRNVEDLAAVVNSLYSKYGATLDSSYMMFVYAGQTHLMVKLNKEMFDSVKKMMDKCHEEGKDVNDVVVARLTGAIQVEGV